MVQKVGLQTNDDLGFSTQSSPTIPNQTDSLGFSDLSDTGKQGLTTFDTTFQDAYSQLDAIDKGLDTPVGPQVLYSRSTNKMFVNGATFDADDYQSALESRPFLSRPPAKPPEDIPDWQVITPDSFTRYIRDIKNPSTGTLASRNLDIGIDNLKLLGGRALQFYGAEETGQSIVNDALQDLYKNQPFQREFTEIEFGDEGSNGAIDWFVANFAQQIPNLAETILVGLAGAGIGGVTGGANPFSAVGGAVLSIMTKDTYKKALRVAAEKYSKKQPLTNGEKKLLREATGISAAAFVKNPKVLYGTTGGAALTRKEFLKREAERIKPVLEKAKTRDKITGGVGAVTLSSQTMGIGDIYGESIDTGDPDRVAAALGSIPYAALELLPEFVLAKKIFGVNPKKLNQLGKDVAPIAGVRSTLVGAKDTAGRVGSGFTVGGALEGATELGQEGLLLSLTGQISDAETAKRLVNSFAAGFAVGGPIGGLAGFKKPNEPTNILGSNEPEPKTTKDKLPENPDDNSPISPKPTGPLQFTRSGQPTPQPAVRSRDLRRQSIVSSPAGLSALPVGQQLLINQGRRAQQQEAALAEAARQEALFREQAVEAQRLAQERLKKGRKKKPAVKTQPEQTATAVQPTPTPAQPAVQQPVIRSRDLRRQGAAALLAQPAVQAQPEVENKTVEDFTNELRQEYQAEQQIQPSRQTTTQPAVQPEENVIPGTDDINSPNYVLKNKKPIGQLNQQELIELRNRLNTKGGKRTARESRDLQAVLVQLPRLEATFKPAPTQEQIAGRVIRRGEALRNRPKQVLYQIPNTPQGEINLARANSQLTQRSYTLEDNTIIPAGTAFINLEGTPKQHAQFKKTLGKKIKTTGKEAENAYQATVLTPEQQETERQRLVNEQQQLMEDNNAVQEQSTDEVAVQEPTRRSEGVRERDQQAANVETTQQGETQDQRATEETGTTQVQKAPEEQIDEQINREPIRQSTNIQREDNILDVWIKKYNEFIPGVTFLNFNSLTDNAKQKFIDIVAKKGANNVTKLDLNKTIALHKEELRSSQRFLERFLLAKNEFESTDNAKDMAESASELITLALGVIDIDTSSRTRTRAYNYIDKITNQSDPIDDRHLDVLDNAYVNFIALDVKKSAESGKARWFQFGLKRGHLFRDTDGTLNSDVFPSLTITRLPSIFKPKVKEVSKEPLLKKTQQEEVVGEEINQLNSTQSLERLEDMIDGLLQGRIFIENKSSEKIREIEKLWTNVKREYPNALIKRTGVTLKSYFTNKDKLKTRTDEDNLLVPSTLSAKERAEKQAAVERGRAAEREKENIVDDFDDINGNFFRADGTEIKGTVPIGKIKLIANQLLSKLQVKPKLTVVKNAEDLQVKNPSLYKRASAGRPKGDFGQLKAVGYSIGDQVIIFSDYAKTEEQVKFVVAHETLGHFGFKAFLPTKKLNKVLEEIYDNEGHVRAAANRKIENGQEKFEAIEEVLADNAASIDAHFINKLWNAVKNILNKLGVEFGDDMSRYLINQSRRNLFRGGQGVVNMKTLTSNLERLSEESVDGRYHVETDRADLARNLLGFFGTTKRASKYDGFEGAVRGVSEFTDRLKKKFKNRDFRGAVGQAIEEVQSLDNVADRNEGLQKVFTLFQRQTATVRQLQQEYERIASFSLAALFDKNTKFDSNPTTDEIEQAGELLAYGNAFKAQQITDELIRQAKPLLNYETQRGEVDMNVFEELSQIGIVSREEFIEGFNIDLKITEDTDIPGKFYKPDFEVTDRVYEIYSEQRQAINKAAIDMLEAHIRNIESERQDVIVNFREIVGNNNLNTENMERGLEEITNKYIELYQEGYTQEGSSISYNDESRNKAEGFLKEVNRAMHKSEKLNDWIRGEAGRKELEGEFSGPDYTSIIETLKELNVVFQGQDQKAFSITNPIKDLYLLDEKNIGSEYRAKQTLMEGYVPFTRNGSLQVRVQAFDSSGNPVRMAANYNDSMPYYQMNDRDEAVTAQENINDSFGDNEFTVQDDEGNNITVKLKAEISDTPRSAPVATNLNLVEFNNMLRKIGNKITPEGREQIIKDVTKATDRARKNLQKSFVPGWDKDVVTNIAQHLETASHSAAKTYFRFKLGKILDNNNFFQGDIEKLRRLEADMLAEESKAKAGELNEARLMEAQRKYDAYAHMYKYSAPTGSRRVNIYSGRGVDRTKKTVATLGRGNTFKDKANELVSFYDNSRNIEQNIEDTLSGARGSGLKTFTVVSQLGGSFATGIINLFSLMSHTIPYLSTYNSRNGYGGGFGLLRSSSYTFGAIRDMSDAYKQLSSRGQESLAKYGYTEKLAENTKEGKALREKYNLKDDEAQVLFEATKQGVLQAAQFNSLVGTARGGFSNTRAASAVRTWMSIFSYTEQLNRRATFLAAYRLQRDRLMADNKQYGSNALPSQVIRDQAEAFAIKSVNKSQGEYGMFNRPQMARGNILQYIFMYKQFVIISVQLMRNLAPKEQAAMMGLLFLVGGLKGLPFGEDIMDLIDTLAQTFNIKMGTIDKEIVQAAEKLIPGSGKYILRGALDQSGATISTRLGFGDIIPLTGAGRAGADPWREFTNFLGPVYSAASQGLGTAADTIQLTAETIGLKDETGLSFSSILRNNPLGGIRGLTEASIYAADGRITNKAGRVVSNDVSLGQIFWRALNFHPAEASIQNDIIRMNKLTSAYAKTYKQGFIDRYIKARINNDGREIAKIMKQVNEFNRDYGQTEFKINNFMPSAIKAYDAFTMPAVERYRKFAPKGIRPEIKELLDIYGYDEADLKNF